MMPPLGRNRPSGLEDLQGMLAMATRSLDRVRHEVACQIADPHRHLLDIAMVLMDLSHVRDYFARKDLERRKYHDEPDESADSDSRLGASGPDRDPRGGASGLA